MVGDGGGGGDEDGGSGMGTVDDLQRNRAVGVLIWE